MVDHPEPVLGSATSVRIRILEVGMCGTDAELCSFEYPSNPPSGSEYIIPGHEAIGVVEEVGTSVSQLEPGDLVVPSVRRPCPRTGCPACRSWNPDFCTTGEFTERGLRGAHGFLAEQIVEEERYLYPVPEALRAVGVLTEPLTIAEKGFRQFLAVQRRLPWLREAEDSALVTGKRAVVLGAGPVGILGCMLLRTRGFDVWVYSREPRSARRVGLIESTGARYVSSLETPVADFAAQVGGMDLVYEAAGSSALTFDVVRHLARNGVLILTGVPRSDATIEIPGDSLVTGLVVRNAAMVGTVNAGSEDFRAAIRDLVDFRSSWPEALSMIITGTHSPSEFCRCATEKGADAIKEIIAFT